MREQAKTRMARELRKAEPLSERRLWEQLRNRKLDGLKFVRQFPVGPFIVDFTCRERGLVVEVDGWTHSTASERAYDLQRTHLLQSKGYRVIRFGSDDVLNGMEGVLAGISRAARS